MTRIKKLVAGCLLFPALSTAAELRLLPEDEAGRDLSFVEFRKQLQTVINERDTTAFMAMVDDDVAIAAQKRGGTRKFLEVWQPDSPSSELWSTMQTIIEMGGGFLRSEAGVKFCAPYLFVNFPSDLDMYGHGVVIKENTQLKSGPSANAATVANLSYDVVKVEDWRSVEDSSNNGIRWLKVKTLSGKDGFVDKKVIRSPSDYSACFLHTEDKGWKLVSLHGNE